MFRDIALIRAVHSDRIKRDIVYRQFDRKHRRISRFAAIRRSIGRPIVRLGARIAGDQTVEQNLRLAR